jgi:hypothetical protein
MVNRPQKRRPNKQAGRATEFGEKRPQRDRNVIAFDTAGPGGVARLPVPRIQFAMMASTWMRSVTSMLKP